MKTKIPHLILALSLSLYAAQSASAALVFTFSKGMPGSTIITVSGDTATAGGSGGTNTAEQIGFSASGSGSVRQTGFRSRNDGFDYATFAALGSGALTDTITLTSTGITGGSPTLIDSFQFDGNEFYPVVMDGLANNGDTLSFAGSPDVTGAMAIDFTAFASLYNQTLDKNDGILFVFAPEPSSTALLGLGGLALMLRRKRS